MESRADWTALFRFTPRPKRSARLPKASRLALALCVLALLGSKCPFAPGPMAAGVCAVDITPISPNLAAEYEATFGLPATVNHTDPIFIAGFGNNRPATGYNDQLWARGVVVDGKRWPCRDRIASTWSAISTTEVETIRSLVDPEAAGIDYVVVSSTHQHEGPDTLGIWGPDATTSGIDFALSRLRESVRRRLHQFEAAANMEPARIKFATTDSRGAVARNRSRRRRFQEWRR